ncbi:MAG: LCP family protein [Candidatus Caldatribacteriaceae bacterium]
MRWKVFYVFLGFFIGVVVLFGFMLFGIENPFRLVVVRKVIDYTVAKTLPGNFCSLVIGQDGIKPVRSDTLMLLFVNTQSEEILLFSIPRDTRLSIPGVGEDKINHAYARGGVALLKRTVEEALGMKIPYFVEINYDGFEKVIDALGGVEIEVEKPLRYIDKAQNLYINIPAGKQVLDGKKALQYVRFRHDPLGDIGRIQRQQNFVKALLTKMDDPSLFMNVTSVIEELKKSVNTNLSTENIVQLALWFRGLEDKKLETETMPGEPVYINGISFWEPDLVAFRQHIYNFLSKGKESLGEQKSHNGNQESR